MFLCEHSWDPPGVNFAIFRCHHCFQRIAADIQLHTQFPSRNLPICADELIETLFVSWCDSCAWPSGTWLVFQVAVATAEMCRPPPHCANTHCLVSVNVQQASVMSLGAIFSAWRNSITHLCFIRTSMSDAILSDCSSAVICRTATKFNGILVGRFNLYCHINNICL